MDALIAMRKPFPDPAPDPALMDLPALVAWFRACTTQWVIWTKSGDSGTAWSVGRDQAQRTLATRVRDDGRASGGMCEHCHQQRATSHVVYQPDDAPRIAHYCSACKGSMPSGWFGVTEAHG